MNPFQRMFSGLLLVMIDIHFGVIEVLPDFVGFLLVLSALNGLEGSLKGMKGARVTALVISLAAIPQLFLGQPAGTVQGVTMASDPVTIYHQSIGLIKLVLSFYLFQVLIKWAEKNEKDDLTARAKRLFRVYLTAHLIYYAIMPFSLNIPENWVIPILVIGLVGVIILEIALLLLLRAFQKEQSNISL